MIVRAAGELDVASVAGFGATLLDAAQRTPIGLIVDLSDVEFIDSSGLGVLLEAHVRLQRDRKMLAIVAPRGTPAGALLTLAGVRRHLTVFESMRAALRGVRADGPV